MIFSIMNAIGDFYKGISVVFERLGREKLETVSTNFYEFCLKEKREMGGKMRSIFLFLR